MKKIEARDKNKIPVLVIVDELNINEVFRLDENLDGFAHALIYNFEEKEKHTFYYDELTKEEWQKCEIVGKVEGGEDLTPEEQAIWDADHEN